MADYLTLSTINTQAGYGDFVKRLQHAIREKAHAIAQLTTPTDKQITWAKEALANPDSQRHLIEGYIYAEFSANSVAQIFGAPDSGANSLQGAVDAAVDNLLSK